jgi:hypothetical protein
MSYQTYSLTRVIDGERSEFAQSFTISDDDAINCAHMLAAGFNTMSRNMMGEFVLAVVDKKAGVVQYDGKAEMINRLEPSGPFEFTKTFNFEVSQDNDGMTTLFDNENGRLIFPTSLKFTPDEPSAFAHIARTVLEDAYDEYLLVCEMLSEIGVETIPISAGVDELRERVAELTKRNNHEFHARSMYEQVEGQKWESARAELIGHVKAAYGKWSRVDPGRTRSDLKSHLRGMIEVLSKFLVAIGEADADERHAAALRVCEIPEGNYLYDDA